MLFKYVSKIFFIPATIFLLNSCIHVEIKRAGVFNELYYDYNSKYYTSTISIPPGVYGKKPETLSYDPKDGSRISFRRLGSCGSLVSFTGIMIPAIPYLKSNSCSSDGFYIKEKWALDLLGVEVNLSYDGIVYEPYNDNGSIKFKIPNFKEFKKAKDKTLIIHKRRKDGTLFTKELPFEWKTVVEVSGGL